MNSRFIDDLKDHESAGESLSAVFKYINVHFSLDREQEQ